MGTLMWYEKSENTIFKKTLGRLKPYLQEIGYKGDIDINCIVNSRGIVPLEATMRFGSPAIHLHDEIHLSPWGEFLMAMSKGEQYDLKYRKGFSVVVSVAIPPFPYHIKAPEIYLKEVRIFFKKELTPAEWKRVHFEEVYLKEPNTDDFRVAGSNGFILYVSGSGTTVEKARKSAYSLIDKIIIPKMMYRTDIGAEFMKGDGALLKKWGWV
jgi:phosphoribosylamine--glycine ligase